MLRAADPTDAAALCAIYNQGIAERQATFETRERTVQDVLEWLDDTMPIVVEAGPDGAVRGFARLQRFSERDVYSGVGDHAVYVHRDARGQGVGRRLLEALCAEAERLGFYKVTSRVFATNAASRAVHRAAGFREVGIQERHGRLDGTWYDCVLVERLLGEAAADADADADADDAEAA
jgi:phosphinothricin acetyltransferase